MTDPTTAAMRAARAITDKTGPSILTRSYGSLDRISLAELIDRETGLAELLDLLDHWAAACCGTSDNPCQLCEQARAALERHGDQT